MKKMLSAICLIVLVMTTLTGCGSSNDTYEIALITDTGTIDDKSFNQGAWEGVEQYAKESGASYKYYKPAEKATDSLVNTIDLAVEGGAKVIVCSGFLFEPAVYEAQTKYPEVKFILIDGQPHDADGKDYTCADNVYSVFYNESQAGFLAGYAAVKEGYKNLGFMGGMASGAVVRFGYGFVEGADYAAKELGIEDVAVRYHYTGTFNASPEIQSMAASWYNDGVEVIFACGGQIGNSIMNAAEANNGKVIGVDVDQSSESNTVITSAMKEIKKSVYDALKLYQDNKFPGGEIVTLDAASGDVGLPFETSKFTKFSKEEYDAIFAKLVANEITLTSNTDVENVEKVPVEKVKVTSIE